MKPRADIQGNLNLQPAARNLLPKWILPKTHQDAIPDGSCNISELFCVVQECICEAGLI